MSVKITTKSTELVSACLLEVEAGTTGLRGGDAGHGGRTYLRFSDSGGSDMRIHVSPAGNEVSLVFGGDAELTNLIDGLQFALDVLKESKESGTSEYQAKLGNRTVE